MSQGTGVLFDGERKYFSRHLSDTGLLGGNVNMNGDYSETSDEFYIIPRAGESRLWIARIIISIEDTSGMQADEYGNLGSALDTGVSLFLKNDTETLIDFMDGESVTTNAEWGRLCFDVEVKAWGNQPTNELLVARWSFFKGGQYIRVGDGDNERFGVTVADDLEGLVMHEILAQGFVHE